MTTTRIPQRLHIEAQYLRSKRMTLREIGAALGVSESSVRRMLGTLESARIVDRRYTERADDKAEAMRLLRKVPPDTRSLTARIAGDPLPGRSALDRRAP